MLEGLDRGGKWLTYVCKGLSCLPCREDHRGVSGCSQPCAELKREDGGLNEVERAGSRRGQTLKPTRFTDG